MGPRNRNKKRDDKQPVPENQRELGKNEIKRRMRKRSAKNSTILGYSVVLSVIVLVVAIWWRTVPEDEAVDGVVHTFLESFVCRDRRGGGYCHDALIPFRRTQKVKRYIRPFEVVLKVPRHLQIWDLDVMRDEFFQKELSSARHLSTGNPLDSGAHLAAYLARRNILIQQQNDSNATRTTVDPMADYFEILPTYQEVNKFHPVTWTELELSTSLGGRHSSAFQVAKGYRDMVLSEYKAFCSVSFTFAREVSEDEYKRMRIHVMSRSFGPGPPGPEEAQRSISLQDELQQFKETFGVELSLGCRAMVPILDMYNHHARPNVDWKYHSNQRAFVITASSQGIPSGHEVMDSYGKYTDAHLFAKFGFVNGDGSGYTQASIASLHQLYDVGMKQQFSYLWSSGATDDIKTRQKRDMIRYLQFDDGHEECIQEELHQEAFELKQLKFQSLLQIANIPDRWIFRMPPRDGHSKPSSSSNIPITTKTPRFDNKDLLFDGSKLISTCRLVVLRQDDFDGKAKCVLRDILENKTAEAFIVGRQSDALEFRALECLVRLSGIMLKKFLDTSGSVTEEMELVSALTKNKETFQSRNWTTAHVRLGEMQTLEFLKGVSLSGMRQLGAALAREENLVLRQQPCPLKYSQSLLHA